MTLRGTMDPPPLMASLPDGVVEDILLRIPPTDPATLVRAAAVEKRLFRLVAGEGFRRRYRALHGGAGAAPMLGFFCDLWDGRGGFFTSFVPAASSSFRPSPRGGAADHHGFKPEDARHGRVLLIRSLLKKRRYGRKFESEFGLVVWCPTSGRRVVLPRPKGFCDAWEWKATVLCAAPAGSCDHLGCYRHRGNFLVVVMGDYSKGLFSCVYSSQSGAWSKITFVPHCDVDGGDFGEFCDKRCAHVGNALYSIFDTGTRILKYDLGTREFSVMEAPPLLSHEEYVKQVELTTMEDGQLGLAVLLQSTLYILSADQEFRWRHIKTIDLETGAHYVPSTTIPPFLLAFEGDVGLVFIISENNGILSVDIRSSEVKVVDKRTSIHSLVPYINLCIPAMAVPSKDDRPTAGASIARRSCVACNLLSQGNGTGGQSQQPVCSHRARAVGRLQPRLRLATHRVHWR